MTQDPNSMQGRAMQARERLVQLLGPHPAISLIDIGYDPERKQGAVEDIVLRVHLRWEIEPVILGLPDEVDGFSVRLISGANYQLE